MYAGRELWWESRQRDREPTRLNFELIVRKSIKDTTIEYINHCTVAGIKEIREPDIDIRQRVIYTLIFLVSFISLIYVLKYTESQTFSNPLVVTRESSTYSIDMIDFPAVAICNVNRISKKSLEMYTKELYEYATASNPDISLNQTELYEYIKQYGKLIDFTFTEDMLMSPIIDEEFDKRGSHRIMNVMEQLAPSCDEMLLKCAWAGNIINCTEIFDVRRTVRGHCCVFNYVVGHNSAVRPNKTKIKKVLRQNERGVIHGLHVIMDPLIEDYAYPLRAVQGFDILLFEPTNYPDPTGGRVIHRFISPNEVSNLELESTKQLAAPEVRHYPRYTRRCLFHNEMPDLFGDMYSYSTCIVRCRLKTVQTLCKCAPYFLPSSEHSIFTCTLERLRCLNKYKEKLLYQYPYKAETLDGLEMEVEDALSCPECLPDCEFTHHNSKVFKLPITLARGGYEFGHKEHRTLFSVPNLTNKCVLNVFQSAGDGRLNRLDIISYWFEILSNVGGYAGILLGFSIISAMEVVYFVIFRFPRVFYNNYIKYS